MVNSYKYIIKKGFITPLVLVTMMSLFLLLAYNVPKVHGIYKNIEGLEDTNKEKNLEAVQGYLRAILKDSEIHNKDDALNIFSNKNVNLKLTEFQIFFDRDRKYFVKKGLKEEVLFLDFDFDSESKRINFIPIEKGEIYNDF